MLTSVHLVTGAGIGLALGDPWLAAPVTFFSHYILDAIPHFSFKPLKGARNRPLRKIKIHEAIVKGIEPFLGLVLVGYFAVNQDNPQIRNAIISGAFFGWLPDLLVFLEWKYGIKRPSIIRYIENKTHKHDYGTYGILMNLLFFLLGLSSYFLLGAR